MLIAGLCLLLATTAIPKTPTEYDVKLVYLYNFTRFINWPESTFKDSADPFSICVMGEIPSKDSALKLEEKRSKNRAIDISILETSDSTETCHILFITKSVEFTTMSAVARNASRGTLTIGESPGFAKHNGEIGFLMDNRNHVRVEINLHRAIQKDIEIRAKLLEIARKVYRDGES